MTEQKAANTTKTDDDDVQKMDEASTTRTSTSTTADMAATTTQQPPAQVNPGAQPKLTTTTTTSHTPIQSGSRPATAASAAGVASASRAPSPLPQVDDSKPQDFEGEVATNNELPSLETLRRIENHVVLDRHGKSHTFKSLYNGRNVARRVLIIFVRHFFCGYCQEYIRTVSENITPEMLLELPISTFVAIVGCGAPKLIDMYASATGCQFPIYTDPTRALYDSLGMVSTLDLGERPAYARRSFAMGVLGSIVQGLKQIPKGLVTRGGNSRQVGGEFLFEPPTVLAPLVGQGFGPGHDQDADEGVEQQQRKRSQDHRQGTAAGDDDDDDAGDGELAVEEKRVTWCHRMRSTRDHVEVPELMDILGLDGHGKPARHQKRWSRAIETRKGNGATLAKEMSEMSEAAARMRLSGEGIIGSST